MIKYKCKECGDLYEYEMHGKGYARDLCSAYCDGLRIGWNKAINAALNIISESSEPGCYSAVERLEK